MLNGIKKERIREACLAVLYVSTGENQYYEPLEKILLDGDTLRYSVTIYLYQHQKLESEQFSKLLKLNEENYAKKKQKK